MKIVSKSLSDIRLVVLAGLLIVGGLSAGCSKTDNPVVQCSGSDCPDAGGKDECEKPADCPVGEQCVEGRCESRPPCEEDSDCPGEQYCNMGGCYSPKPDTKSDVTPVVDGGVDAAGDAAPRETGTPGDAAGDGETQGCSGCILSRDAGPTCVPGNESQACGSGGEACSVCGAEETCKDGKCIDKPCTPSSCPMGCCLGTQCLNGDTDMACGTGGESCAQCTGDTVCKDSKCEVPCGPGTCPGCCNAMGKCLMGDTDMACGSGGKACTQCAGDEKCQNGQCVKLSCSQTCKNNTQYGPSGGCCAGSTCKAGDTDTACGDGGDPCEACRSGFECQFQECDLQRNSRWDVVAVDAELPEKNKDGNYWDGSGDPPDPYVKVKVEGWTKTKSGKTKKVENDRTPFWWETTAPKVRAADLKRTNKTVFEVIDEDPWWSGGDTQVVKCKMDFEERHFEGGSHQFTCTNHSGATNPVTVKITFRLRHQ